MNNLFISIFCSITARNDTDQSLYIPATGIIQTSYPIIISISSKYNLNSRGQTILRHIWLSLFPKPEISHKTRGRLSCRPWSFTYLRKGFIGKLLYVVLAKLTYRYLQLFLMGSTILEKMSHLQEMQRPGYIIALNHSELYESEGNYSVSLCHLYINPS